MGSLCQRAKHHELTPKEVNLVAAYLFAALLYGNGQRLGAVLNRTMWDYKNRRERQEGGFKYLEIKSGIHNTCSTHGPAGVVLFTSRARILDE